MREGAFLVGPMWSGGIAFILGWCIGYGLYLVRSVLTSLHPLSAFFRGQNSTPWDVEGNAASRHWLPWATGLALGALFSATFLDGGLPASRFIWCVFWVLMVSVTVTDLVAMRVPNVISLGGTGVIFVGIVTLGLRPIGACLLGMLLTFGVLLAIHLVSGGRLGLGDVKLYLVVGAMLGFLPSMESLFFASVSGTLVGGILRLTGKLDRNVYIPFVPHIVVGVIVTVFFGPGILHWYESSVLQLAGHT